MQRERGEFRFITGGPVIGRRKRQPVNDTGRWRRLHGSGTGARERAIQPGCDPRVPRDHQSLRREVGGSAGGALSIVTQSGTNTFTGRVFGFFRSHRSARGRRPGTGQSSLLTAAVRHRARRTADHEPDAFVCLVRTDQRKQRNAFPAGRAYRTQAADLEVPPIRHCGFGRLDHQLNPSSHLATKVVYERFRQENFRVGGAQDVSYGQDLNRDNWNVNAEHAWAGTGTQANQFHIQMAKRRYEEPRNSTASPSGSAAETRCGRAATSSEICSATGRFMKCATPTRLLRNRHDIRTGFSVQHVRERSRIDVYQSGLFIYVTDTRALPLAYVYGDGSGDVRTARHDTPGIAQDDWAASPDLRLNLGLRYDLDTKGNNPGFRHPLVPDGRASRHEQHSAAGRVLLGHRGIGRRSFAAARGVHRPVPAHAATRRTSAERGHRPDRADADQRRAPRPSGAGARSRTPRTTGIPQAPDIGLMDRTLMRRPQCSSRADSQRLGFREQFFDIEGIYVDGGDEIIIRDTNFGGNGQPRRLNTAFSQINTYTNEGRSQYKAVVLGLNGALKGGHSVHGVVHAGEQEEHRRRLQPRVSVRVSERSGEHRSRVRPQPQRRAPPRGFDRGSSERRTSSSWRRSTNTAPVSRGPTASDTTSTATARTPTGPPAWSASARRDRHSTNSTCA